LEIALFCLHVAREGGLGYLVLELVQNLSVCDVTHLKVLAHELSSLEANTALRFWHQRITRLICLASIAIDARPSFLALAFLLATPWASVLAVWQRPAKGF
jgi:hypothetical protein